MVRCQSSLFLFALVGFFASNCSSLDVPRSYVRRSGDGDASTLQKLVQSSEFSGKRSLQVVKKSNTPNDVATTGKPNATTPTEDQIAGPVITDILVQIVEVIVINLASYLIDLIVSIITGRTASTASGSTVLSGLNALNNTSLNDALSVLTKNLANVTADTTTEDQIGGPIITDILTQIIEIVVVAFADAILDFIIGIITGRESTTTINEVLTDLSKSIANVTSVASATTEDQIGGPIITDILAQIIEIVIISLTDAILDFILGIITGSSRRRNLKSSTNRSLANVTTTTEDQIGGPIIQDILSQIVAIIVDVIADAILTFIEGILTGDSLSADSTTGGGLSASVNTTALASDISTNVTVTINELNNSTNGTVSEDQLIESIAPNVIVLVVTAVSDTLITAINTTVDSEPISDLLVNIIATITDPLIDFLINTVVGNVVTEESTTTLGSMNTTGFIVALDDLGSSLANVSSSGTVSEETIQQIFDEALPALIEAIILIFAQAIANAINDTLFGLFANSSRRQLTRVNSHGRSLANVTSATEDQIGGPIITDILAQIIEIVVISLTDAILDFILGLITGSARRRNLKSSMNRSLANVTTTTEDQIGGPIIQDILSGIVEVIIGVLADAILTFIEGILTGESLSADSTTGGGLSASVNTTALASDMSTNVTVTINELNNSTNGTVSEDQLIESIAPNIIVLVVTAVSDTLITTINTTVVSEPVSDFLVSIVATRTDPLIDFLIGNVLGNAVTEESTSALGSMNTTGFIVALDDLGSSLANVSSSGTVSEETIQQILEEALPALIEAIILIFAQAIANAINSIIFGLQLLLPFARRRDLQEASNTTAVEEDQILTTIIAIIVNALVSSLITAIIALIFGTGDGTARATILSDLESTISNITATIASIDDETVVDKVFDIARDEPVKKLRGILDGL